MNEKDKTNNPYSTTFVNRTHAFECYVICCGFKNNHQKDMYSEEIKLRAQIMITILVEASITDNIRDFALINEEY